MLNTYNKLFRYTHDTIKSYRLDLLKIDRNILDEWHGPFIHVTRKNGTHLIKTPYHGLSDKVNRELAYSAFDYVNAIKKVYNLDVCTIHYFDGKTLIEIRPNEIDYCIAMSEKDSK